jgi:hypothetical protein
MADIMGSLAGGMGSLASAGVGALGGLGGFGKAQEPDHDHGLYPNEGRGMLGGGGGGGGGAEPEGLATPNEGGT